jgi:hypothetical protein
MSEASTQLRRSSRISSSQTTDSPSVVVLDEPPPPSATSPVRLRKPKSMIPFLGDPHPRRSAGYKLSKQQIGALEGPDFLSASIINHLLYTALPFDVPDDLLITSSDAITYIKDYNDKFLLSKNGENNDGNNIANRYLIRSVNNTQKSYQHYSLKHYNLIGINLSHDHFFVVQFGFNINSKEIFDNVMIYDSLRRTNRNSKDFNKNSVGAKCLRDFQNFLQTFVFNEHPNNKV